MVNYYMHAPQKDSPSTYLTQSISSTDITINVADASVLPAVVPFPIIPFPVTLGYDTSLTETVMVTAISGNQLTVTRGDYPLDWPLETTVARTFNAEDWSDVIDNIEDCVTQLGNTAPFLLRIIFDASIPTLTNFTVNGGSLSLRMKVPDSHTQDVYGSDPNTTYTVVCGDYTATMTVGNLFGIFIINVPQTNVKPQNVTCNPLIGHIYIPAIAIANCNSTSTPVSWSSSGLPDGFDISSSGLISGSSPIITSGSFTVTATNSAGSTTSDAITYNIQGEVGLPTGVTCTPLTSQAGTSATAQASCVSQYAITWTAVGLPSGFTIDANSGYISGTSSSITSGSFIVTATNIIGSSSSSAISYNFYGPLVSKPTHLHCPTVRWFSNCAPTLMATCTSPSPVTWTLTITHTSWGSLAIAAYGELDIGANTGIIEYSFSPSLGVGGVSGSFTLTATNEQGSTSLTGNNFVFQSYYVNSESVPVYIECAPIYNSSDAITQVLATCYSAEEVVWTASGLPSGFTIDSSTGVISGISYVAGNGTFIVRATNSNGYAQSDPIAYTLYG